MSLGQIMQASMATLRAATTRHLDTDKALKAMNGTQGKLHVLTQLANKTHKPSKNLYELPPPMISLRDC